MGKDRESKLIDPWLERLEAALATLPAGERDDILKETRSHLAARIDSGRTPDEVLAGFGPAEGYARTLLLESGTVEPARSRSLSSSLVRLTFRSIVAAGAFFIVALLAASALSVAQTALYKLGNPAQAGLWRGHGGFFIGVIDDPHHGHELLGKWIFPLAVLSVVLAWLVGRWVVRRALKIIARAR
jgi:hypothetical protein